MRTPGVSVGIALETVPVGIVSESVPVITLAVVLAVLFEKTIQEPPAKLHPVVWFGRAVAPIDSEWNYPRPVGLAVAIGYPLAGSIIVYLLVFEMWAVEPVAGVFVASVILFVTTSLGMLLSEATAVIEATEGNISAARDRLPALAGRDPAELTSGEIRSAAVESASENLADGLVAPLLAFTVFAPISLPLGAAAAWWVKAVNTLDSMLGYRSKAVGTASARLDDIVMWVPARVSAVLLSISAAHPRALLTAKPLVSRPPSPNSGWPMGVLAAALAVRLEKPGSYELAGGSTLPSTVEAKRGVRIVGRAGILAYALSALIGVILWL